MSQGGHSEPLLLLALFYQSTPSCLKVRGGWGGWVGGPCDSSVSPSPFGLDFGTLDFGSFDLGLTISPDHLESRVCFTCHIISLSRQNRIFPQRLLIGRARMIGDTE